MGVDSAIINFYAGLSRVLDVAEEYGLRKGEFASMFCRKKDDSRMKECNRKASDTGKSSSSRQRLRAIRQVFADKVKEKEGLVYGSGICDMICYLFTFILLCLHLLMSVF